MIYHISAGSLHTSLPPTPLNVGMKVPRLRIAVKCGNFKPYQRPAAACHNCVAFLMIPVTVGFSSNYHLVILTSQSLREMNR